MQTCAALQSMNKTSHLGVICVTDWNGNNGWPYRDGGYPGNTAGYPPRGAYMPQPNQMYAGRVNGKGGADAFQMGAYSTAFLLDESGLIMWIVTTDGAGYKTIAPYDLTPHQDTPAPDFSNLVSRIEKLEGFMNEFYTPNTASTRKRKATDAGGESD